MSRETISVVILTMNYEAMIEEALKSAAGWADEIVIIDGFSADRTVEICRRYTDKIFQNKWDRVTYASERNLGIEKASCDWVLQIDPDERLTPEFKKTVSLILEKGTPHVAFEFRKKNFFFGHWMRYGGWYHYSLHLFRRTRSRYEGILHLDLKTEGSVGKIEASVLHYPFDSFSVFLQKQNWYSKKASEEELVYRGRHSDKVLAYNLKAKPLKRFFKFYIRKKGFLDGEHGLIFCVLYAWVHFLNWAKYWELLRQEKPQ